MSVVARRTAHMSLSYPLFITVLSSKTALLIAAWVFNVKQEMPFPWSHSDSYKKLVVL